jgi:hypothetical protein
MSEVQAIVIDEEYIVHLPVTTLYQKCLPAELAKKSITLIPWEKSWKETEQMNVC